ncbi:MAG: hypothetical protein RMM17_00645 [Acidobacteriota bacterium]|nr:hypothetical protein [Blastocatellia bacterium]MDW8411175.1 hypothetical protein [Acidobacteriota bacterium]
MESTNLFSTRRINKPDTTSSEIIYRGQPTGLILEGLILEQQFACKNGYLLLLTDDCPFEEGLHIHLLNFELQHLDTINMGKAYLPGMLQNVTSSNETLNFSFFGDDSWQLRVLQQPRFRISPYSGSWATFFFPLHRPLRFAFKPNYLRLEGTVYSKYGVLRFSF